MRVPFLMRMTTIIDNKAEIKFKLMTLQDLVISLDRLTRFKNPEIKYRRVFYDIILRHLISPSVSKHKLDELPPSFLVSVVQEIWNTSVKSLFDDCSFENSITLRDLDNQQYNISDDYTLELMNSDLNFYPILKNIDIKDIPKNLEYLKLLFGNSVTKSDFVGISEQIRRDYKTLFPVKKLILTEGITEEILLPKFAQVFGYDFDENGVFILATGGKSKVLSLYAELKYILKIPMFVLLDNDAEPVYNDVCSVLRQQDRAYLIKAGEFEDILSKELIQKAFTEMNYDIKPASIEELSSDEGTCEALELLWKSRGLGEFRKAHLAKAVHDCLSDKSFITDEINSILNYIINL